MFCPNCGTDTGDQNFCPNCGAAVAENAPAAQPANNPAPFRPGYTKTVNKIAYCLIAILLGGLGIHRFYAGKIVSGIVYLIFCWAVIPGILGIIEGILAVTREDDGRGNIPVYADQFFV